MMKKSPFEDAEILINILRIAQNYGMIYEVAQFFIDDIKRGASTKDAALFARREWDI